MWVYKEDFVSVIVHLHTTVISSFLVCWLEIAWCIGRNMTNGIRFFICVMPGNLLRAKM